ncbi:MAG: AhpC/TSA family protein [Anaerolineae bacterium]
MRLSYDAIKSLNAEVLLVSFGTEYWVRVWLEETQSPFLLLLDPDRAAYRAYGLERSLLRSWGGKTIWRYARLLLAGRRWRGIQGDSGQLGGDFIIDAGGLIRLARPSQDPTDRPPVADLLAVLEELNR